MSENYPAYPDFSDSDDLPVPFNITVPQNHRILQVGDSINFTVRGEVKAPSNLDNMCDLAIIDLDSQKEEILFIPHKTCCEVVEAVCAAYVDEKGNRYNHLEAGLEFNLARVGHLTYKLYPSVEEGLTKA